MSDAPPFTGPLEPEADVEVGRAADPETVVVVVVWPGTGDDVDDVEFEALAVDDATSDEDAL